MPWCLCGDGNIKEEHQCPVSVDIVIVHTMHDRIVCPEVYRLEYTFAFTLAATTSIVSSHPAPYAAQLASSTSSTHDYTVEETAKTMAPCLPSSNPFKSFISSSSNSKSYTDAFDLILSRASLLGKHTQPLCKLQRIKIWFGDVRCLPASSTRGSKPAFWLRTMGA